MNEYSQAPKWKKKNKPKDFIQVVHMTCVISLLKLCQFCMINLLFSCHWVELENQIKQIHEQIIPTSVATDQTHKNDSFTNGTLLFLLWTLINSFPVNNNIKMCLLKSSFTYSFIIVEWFGRISCKIFWFPQETKSHRFTTIPRWVNNDGVFILGELSL